MDSSLNNKEIFALNQIFAELYESDNCQKAFTQFLENLKDFVAFQKGDAYFYTNNDDHIIFRDFIFVDWNDDLLEKYINKYADIDDVLPIVSLKKPIMFKSSDVFIPNERMKTKYYNELLLPAGMEYSIEGNIYMGDDGYVAGIGIHRPDKYGDFSQKELEIMKLSRPHLVNVAKKFIHNKTDIASCALSLDPIYDFGQIGVCIFDENYIMKDSNLIRSNFLKPEHSEEMNRALITLSKSLGAKIKKDGFSETSDENRVHSRITIGHEHYYAEIACCKCRSDKCRFIATVYDSNNIMEKFFLEIKDRFNLTNREYEILKCAMKGMNNADISKRLFISMPTVKKHLTNIYQKTGVEGKHQILNVITD